MKIKITNIGPHRDMTGAARFKGSKSKALERSKKARAKEAIHGSGKDKKVEGGARLYDIDY